MKHRISTPMAVGFLVLGGLRGVAATEEDNPWPRQFEAEGATVSLYQPQPESFEGDDLAGRAVVSVVTEELGEPVFGTVWISARVETDREERLVYVRDVSVPRVRFPDATLQQEAKLSRVLEAEIPKWDVEISLDRLLTTLEVAEKELIEAEQLETAPPRIVVRKESTVLITIDGDPQLTRVEGSSLMRVSNTPFLIVFDSKTKSYYIYGGEDLWYASSDLKGDWVLIQVVPEEVAALAPKPEDIPADETGEEDEAEGSDVVPGILVVTEPTELIQVHGEPAYTPVADNDLMFVSNTDASILLEVETQKTYVVLAGRWYVADSFEGPWSYVEAGALPEAFGRIEADSDIGDVRVHVAGTEEALDAVLDAQIPQTATVDRATASLTVEYDGEPEFEAIPGTELSYAVNTPNSVLRAGALYYACEDGVWFVSNSATGPWEVATERPEEVEEIPASCPVYNVKYVYVYHSTPTVVYVGYTPAYLGCYVYRGTIVYGTGYYYPGWHGTVYYARPATWGVCVRWNPWTGWSFGIRISNGRFTFGIGFGTWCRWRGGWWGPARYHGYRRGYRRGYHHGFRRGATAGFRAGMRRSNVYRANNRPGVNPPGRKSPPVAGGPGARPGAGPGSRPGAGPGNRPGPGGPGGEGPDKRPGGDVGPGPGGARRDLYADRAGNVHQPKVGGGWEPVTRGGGSGRTAPSTAPSTGTRPGAGSGGSSTLNRQQSARQRGNQRSQSFSGASRGSSGGRPRPRGPR
jgi:hypothetical protein